MNKELFLEEKYIKTKKKYRKIVTYVDGENLLREKHERIVSLLKQECSDSIFAKAYIEHSSIVKIPEAGCLCRSR